MDLKERIKEKVEELQDERALQEMEQWLDALTGRDKEKFSEEEVRSALKGNPQYSTKPEEEKEQSRVLRDGPAKAGKREQ